MGERFLVSGAAADSCLRPCTGATQVPFLNRAMHSLERLQEPWSLRSGRVAKVGRTRPSGCCSHERRVACCNAAHPPSRWLPPFPPSTVDGPGPRDAFGDCYGSAHLLSCHQGGIGRWTGRLFPSQQLFPKRVTDMDETQNPYQSSQSSLQPLEPQDPNASVFNALAIKKRRYLIAMLILLFLVGLVEGILPLTDRQMRRLDTICGIISAVLVYQWCAADALQRSATLWKYAALTFVICPGPMIVLPIYFIRSRGVGLGLIATLYAVGFAAIMFAVSMLGVVLGSLVGEFARI